MGPGRETLNLAASDPPDCNLHSFDLTHFNTSMEEHMRLIPLGVIKEMFLLF